MRIALLGPANSIHLRRWAHALAGRGHAVGVFSQHACERELLPTAASVFRLIRPSGTGAWEWARPPWEWTGEAAVGVARAGTPVEIRCRVAGTVEDSISNGVIAARHPGAAATKAPRVAAPALRVVT